MVNRQAHACVGVALPAGTVSPGTTRPCARAGRGDGVQVAAKLVGGMLYNTCAMLCACQQHPYKAQPGHAPGWPGAMGGQAPAELKDLLYRSLHVTLAAPWHDARSLQCVGDTPEMSYEQPCYVT